MTLFPHKEEKSPEVEIHHFSLLVILHFVLGFLENVMQEKPF